MRNKIFVFFILFLFPFITESQEFNISVKVHGNNKNLNNKIQSILNHQFRKLDNVKLTNSHPKFRFHITAMHIKSENQILGLQLSILITKPSDINESNTKLNKEQKTQLQKYFQDKEKILKNKLITIKDDEKEINETLFSIVRNFDIEYLEKLRKK